DLIAAMNVRPTILLDKVYANDQAIPLQGKNIFNHTVNHFIFQWVLTDYNNPLRNRYYYRLTGIDSARRFAGNKGEVEFVNLSPGKYSLQMYGENANGISSGKILTYNFEINNPFWLSWWFITLMILCIAAIFYMLYLFRLRQLKRIEQLRNKISLDLHDDIGSTLSSISILSEMALQEEKNKDMLSEIKENSLDLMERMDDIVWSINPVNDSMEMLLLRIKTFSSKLFEAKNIRYDFNISEHIGQLHIDMEKRRQIYLLLKEAVNNMVKYAQCTEAKIMVDYHSPSLKIHISDNGIGFDENNIVYGNGINGMKKRAKWLNADLQIQSVVNEGTHIYLNMKIK
ncbi:MAG: triple tyrosine motif-containing protein, partial [Bacteroidota bacterium]